MLCCGTFTLLKLLMTVEEARKLMGDLWKDYESMTDEEIQRLIDYIDAISSFAIEEYLKEKLQNNSA